MADDTSEQVAITQEELADAQEQFFSVYGATLAAWSRLEGHLFLWFQLLTVMPEKMARGVFFSARNFNARADMLTAVIEAGTNPEFALQGFLLAALKKARIYSGFRNAATHGEAHINLQTGHHAVKEMVIIQGSKMSHEAEPTMITLRDLKTARQSFDLLAAHLRVMHPVLHGPHSTASIERHHELVLALPNHPHRDEPAQTRVKSQRRRQVPPR